jgi:hypothetical protein
VIQLAIDRDAGVPRHAFDHDDRRVMLARVPCVASEHVAREVPQRQVRRRGVVGDLAEIAGQLCACAADDCHWFAVLSDRWTEQIRQRDRVAQLRIAVVIETMLGLVTSDRIGDKVVNAGVDPWSFQFGELVGDKVVNAGVDPWSFQFGEFVIDRHDALALVRGDEGLEPVEQFGRNEQLVGLLPLRSSKSRHCAMMLPRSTSSPAILVAPSESEPSAVASSRRTASPTALDTWRPSSVFDQIRSPSG